MREILLFFENMDMEKGVWLAAFTAGTLLFLYGMFYCFSRNGRSGKRFAGAAVFEFLAVWILYIPGELFSGADLENPALRLTEAFSTALLKSINIYGGEGYEKIVYEGHLYFTSIYGIVRVFANIALMLFIGGFILKFLDGPIQDLRLFLRKGNPTYLFSGCSGETLGIARTVPAGADSEKKNLVFACGDQELSPDDMEAIEEINGISAGSTVAGTLRKVKRSAAGMEIFLFGGAEADRLIRLEQVLEELNREDTPRDIRVRIYTEILETPWAFYENAAERMIPGQKNIIVNFVRMEENFALDHLLKHSIFENALHRDGFREIRAAIIGGMNDRNLELLKAMLHLAQMPGYRLTLLVLDEGEGRSRLRRLMPEISDRCEQVGDAVYTLDYREHTDLESGKPEEILEREYPDLTLAFVNAGDDLRNLKLALRMKALWKRRGRADGDCRIHVSVRDPRICRCWDPGLLEAVELVGGTEQIYSYGFITLPDIEKASKAIHEVRYGGRKTWEEYCGSEYNRHSVYARTLSFKYKVRLIDEFYGSDHEAVTREERWKVYEHMRWNVYTRTLGYRLADPAVFRDGKPDRTTRQTARVHNFLIAFADLPEEEKKKDSLKLTEEIVEILRNI